MPDETPASAPAFSWRAATGDDLPFLRELYAQHRAPEFAALGWPESMLRTFLDGQFDMQHRNYIACYTPADFLVVLREGRAVGRLYLYGTEDAIHIIDILLMPSERGTGMGTHLLRTVQDAVQRNGMQAVSLQVDAHNHGAQRLYARLGFACEDVGDVQWRMRWRAGVTA